MEELIVKSLTDTLTDVEKATVDMKLNTDSAFRQNYERSLIALALADFVVGESLAMEDVEHRLSEMTSH